MIQSTSRQRNN